MSLLLLAALAVSADKASPEPPGPPALTVCDGYFESNKSGLKGESSYLVYTKKDEFGKVFVRTPPIGGRKRVALADDAFDKGIVVAAVKRGTSVFTYSDVKASPVTDGVLKLTYTAKGTDGGGSATFASPMVVGVAAKDVKEVVFVEGGKEVARVKVGK